MSSWKENVRKVVPYVPGEQPKQEKLIKLNANENPYPPSPKVGEILKQMDADDFRLYPDVTSGVLIKALSEWYHIPEDRIFAGVGSDDVLAMSFLTFFNGKKPILFPDITYSFYDVWAELFRIPYIQKPLNDQFRIVLEDYFDENGGIVIANPNAPTGEALPLSDIEEIISRNRDVVVIVDEAYIDFGGESAVCLTERYDNVLVVGTFSKSRSMAGMRIGFAFGSRELIRYLNDVKFSINSFTMDMPALATGAASLSDRPYFDEIIRKVVCTRERVKPLFRELGFSFGDSMTNFLFVRHRSVPAKQLFEALRAQGIMVRYFSRPRIDNYLRITIGTDGEMDTLLEVLRDYLQKTAG